MGFQRDTQAGTGTGNSDHWSAPLPVPEVREGGESVWDLWVEASCRLDLAFAPTEPSDAAPLCTASGVAETVATEVRPRLLSVQSLMVLARRNNRACPAPAQWTQLYELLGGEGQHDLQAPPLQPWVWPRLSGLQKRLRFREHVEWAERHGRLEQIARFMNALGEGDWVHMGED